MPRCLTYSNKRYQDLNFDFRYSLDEYRLIYVSNAVGRRYIGADVEDFDGEELLLLAPGIPYCYYADYEDRDNYQLIELGFKRDFLGKAIWKSDEFASLQTLFSQSQRVLVLRGEKVKVFASLLNQVEDQGALDRLVTLLATLGELANAGMSTAYEEDVEALTERNIKRLGDVLLYINTKYRRDFRAEKMASALGMSPVSLSRFSAKYLGKTLPEYINDMRINVAKRILLETDLILEDVAKHSGYATPLSFHTNFQKRLAMPPSIYRKKLRGKA